jgi:hypothetical protein
MILMADSIEPGEIPGAFKADRNRGVLLYADGLYQPSFGVAHQFPRRQWISVTGNPATCMTFADWVLPAERHTQDLCGEPSVGVVVAACMHEHVNRRPVCAACAVELQRGWGPFNPYTCQHCFESPQSHDCFPLVMIEWDSGERTIVQKAVAA